MSDFSTQPNSAMDEEPIFDTIISEFESGVEQRRSRRSSSLRRWRLIYTNRDSTTMETVRDFFLARLGAYDDFTWTNPNDDVEYTVRFEEDSLNIRRRRYNLWDFQFVLREVL